MVDPITSLSADLIPLHSNAATDKWCYVPDFTKATSPWVSRDDIYPSLATDHLGHWVAVWNVMLNIFPAVYNCRIGKPFGLKNELGYSYVVPPVGLWVSLGVFWGLSGSLFRLS